MQDYRLHDQIRRKLPIWSHLLKKSVIENFIFSAMHWAIHNDKPLIPEY